MRVPVVIYASPKLLGFRRDKTLEQARNVACLPGIVKASYVMPDGHQGYGFPIGGVAAFDPDRASSRPAASATTSTAASGCSARISRKRTFAPSAEELLAAIFEEVPAGAGKEGITRLSRSVLKEILAGARNGPSRTGTGRRGRPRADRRTRPDADPSAGRFRSGPSSAGFPSSARSARATIFSRSRRSRRSSTRPRPGPSGSTTPDGSRS